MASRPVTYSKTALCSACNRLSRAPQALNEPRLSVWSWPSKAAAREAQRGQARHPNGAHKGSDGEPAFVVTDRRLQQLPADDAFWPWLSSTIRGCRGLRSPLVAARHR